MSWLFANKKLLLIFILGLALRLISLGSVPIGISQDEIGQGYTAYSILKTGYDEWGRTLNFSTFKAFGDYRSTLQTFLMIPSISLFGLSEFAIRLPSAIFGSLSVIVIYFLSNKLFSKLNPGIYASLILALSPWAIQFSRSALEANLFFTFFGTALLLLISLSHKTRNIILSFILFGLSLYTYHSAKLFVHLFLFLFVILNRKDIFKSNIRVYLTSAVIFLLLATPAYLDSLFGGGNSRAASVLITNFSKEELSTISDQQYYSKLNSLNPIFSRILSNKVLYSIDKFTENYFSYLSPSFWFTEGGREITYSTFPGVGLLNLFTLPLIVIAGIYIFKNRHHKIHQLLIIWLVLGILPAALTKEGYRPNRVASLMGLPELIAGVGMATLIESKYFKNKLILISSLIFVLLTLSSYFNTYFFTSPIRYPSAMAYGYKSLVNKVNIHSKTFSKVIIEKGENNHIFFAFYSKLEPKIYQENSLNWERNMNQYRLGFIDQQSPYQLGSYTYKNIDYQTDMMPGTLLVIRGQNLRDQDRPLIIDQVNYYDGKPAFVLLGVPNSAKL